jgi:hypothetical protein
MKLQFWWSKRDKIALEAMKALITKSPLATGMSWENQKQVTMTVAGAFAYADNFLLHRKGKEFTWVRPIDETKSTTTTWIYNIEHPENARPTKEEVKAGGTNE